MSGTELAHRDFRGAGAGGTACKRAAASGSRCSKTSTTSRCPAASASVTEWMPYRSSVFMVTLYPIVEKGVSCRDAALRGL